MSKKAAPLSEEAVQAILAAWDFIDSTDLDGTTGDVALLRAVPRMKKEIDRLRNELATERLAAQQATRMAVN